MDKEKVEDYFNDMLDNDIHNGMSREERIKQVIENNKEIESIEFFCSALEEADTHSEYDQSMIPTLKNHKVIQTNYFFDVFHKYNKRVDTFKIPEYMRVEIQVMCMKWIKELKQRNNELIPN